MPQPSRASTDSHSSPRRVRHVCINRIHLQARLASRAWRMARRSTPASWRFCNQTTRPGPCNTSSRAATHLLLERQTRKSFGFSCSSYSGTSLNMAGPDAAYTPDRPGYAQIGLAFSLYSCAFPISRSWPFRPLPAVSNDQDATDAFPPGHGPGPFRDSHGHPIPNLRYSTCCRLPEEEPARLNQHARFDGRTT